MERGEIVLGNEEDQFPIARFENGAAAVKTQQAGKAAIGRMVRCHQTMAFEQSAPCAPMRAEDIPQKIWKKAIYPSVCRSYAMIKIEATASAYPGVCASRHR